MKKALILLCCISLLTVCGCSSDSATPEDFGKNYIQKQFKGIPCNLEDLDFTVTEEEANKATVTIEGDIKYKETLCIEKKDNQWILASGTAKKTQTEAPKKDMSEKKLPAGHE
jgi:hypothetical protein